MDIGKALSINASRHPEKIAIIFEEKSVTYRQLNALVNQLAWGLLELGLKKGEKISIMMMNSDLFVISYLAAAKIGAIIVPINFRLVEREVNYIIKQSDSVMVICDDLYENTVRKATEEVSVIRNIITVPTTTDLQQTNFYSILSTKKTDPLVTINNVDDIHIIYTSGTTGFPKGAVFDHERMNKLCTGFIGMLGLNSEDRLLHIAPLFHCAQLCIFLLPGILLGTTNVIHREFKPTNVLEAIELNQITLFFGVPTMYNFLLQVSNVHDYDLSSVKRCVYGAAPMAPELVKGSMKLFGTEQFYNLCGQTEGGPTGVYLTPEEHKRHIGKSGRTPMLFTEVRVVNENGRDVLPGEVGEMILRSEVIMKEYYNKPIETGETLKDGWLHTGDLAEVDVEGFITLVDRKKDMVITGGENVYTVEIEHVLYEHPAVLEVAVIGTPDRNWGEIVTAYVALKPKQHITKEELMTFCRERLAGYKVPRLIEFIESLPRNASGKIQKFILRESFQSNSKSMK